MKARAILSLSMVAFVVACASTPDSSSTPELVVSAPPGPAPGADPAAFRLGVDAVFERRCGTLDCHGQVGRGMRIYGANGLRLPNDAGLVPGGGATSLDEINANYASIVGLQPEKMNDFLAKTPRTSQDAERLLILSKPLGLERHKGGATLNRGEPAEQCIVTWLVGNTDQSQCALGSRPP